MGFSKRSREDSRLARKMRVRATVLGTNAKPRLCVYRSQKYTYVQLISDENCEVLAAASTKQLDKADKSARCVESAKALGLKIAELAKSKEIGAVVFDRNGYLYHGRIAAVAEGAREGGLNC